MGVMCVTVAFHIITTQSLQRTKEFARRILVPASNHHCTYKRDLYTSFLTTAQLSPIEQTFSILDLSIYNDR